MYCKYGFYTGKPGLMTEKDFKKYGNKSGLPIVAVQNVNRKIFNMQNAFKNRLGEKGKAFSVIIVFGSSKNGGSHIHFIIGQEF